MDSVYSQTLSVLLRVQLIFQVQSRYPDVKSEEPNSRVCLCVGTVLLAGGLCRFTPVGPVDVAPQPLVAELNLFVRSPLLILLYRKTKYSIY
jgi:hypothetical protein